MLVTLVIVAGSAKAQGKFNPYPGGTYHYTLDISLANVSDATLTATGLTAGTSNITNITPSLTNIATTVKSISFDVTYSNDASGTCKIEFVLTDKTSLCSNKIFLNVPMSALPTYALNLTTDKTDYSECQKRSGVSNNSADALGTDIIAEKNTFKYIVTPSVDHVSGTFSYSYKIDLPDGATLLSFNNGSSNVSGYLNGVVTHTGVSAVVTDEFIISFNTTTGVPTKTLTATLSIGSSSTLVVADGGGTYQATSGGSLTQSVDVKAVPTIGTFK